MGKKYPKPSENRKAIHINKVYAQIRIKMKILLSLFCLLVSAFCLSGTEKNADTDNPVLWKEVTYPCEFDNSEQKALVYFAPEGTPRPLIVALHTWSLTYAGSRNYVTLAAKYKCHMIGPDFRGKNNAGNPLSMGSDAAVADIVSAVEWMKKQCAVDPERIYLVGGSGGGHMALLMAGRHPEIWAGVSAWCPISDLKAWCAFHRGKGYGAHIISNLKGDPRQNETAAKEAAYRSPITWLAKAKNVPLDISTGIHDGHKGSVPISHALYAFNAVVPAPERIPETLIEYMVREEKVPDGTQDFQDSSYGKRKIHYRKISGNTRVTIFEGGHHILSGTAIIWLLNQRKGKSAKWQTKASSGNAEKLTR